MAVAALAIAAVATVMLLAGSGPAQATSATLASDSGGGHLLPQPQQTPIDASPIREACSTNPAAAVSSGHIALFDVYWNPGEEELTNNPCPPTVTHTREEILDEDGEPTGEYTDTHDRSASNINIEETVIHVPNSYKVDLNEEGTAYTETAYPEVWEADNAENIDTDDDEIGDGVGDGMIWVLPACPPDGTAGDDDLCISYSATLLNPTDWVDASGADGGAVDFFLDHVHQIDIDEQDKRYVLVYDAPESDATDETEYTAKWNTFNLDHNVISVMPGKYERPMWFFTSPGTYEFQVHVKGHPRAGGVDPETGETSVSGDVREYILHVGAEADLGVTMEVAPANPSPGNDVTITLTASNAGPNPAPKTKADVTLPEGLTYSSDVAATGTDYDSGVWTIGELVKGGSKTLTITATVDANTRGQELAVKATLSAHEKVRHHEVAVLDQDPENNMATSTVTVASSGNTNPMFMVARSVAENSPAGTHVGDPVLVKDPDAGDTLHYSLSGSHAGDFAVENVPGGAQIKVANNAILDLDITSAGIDLELHVRDSKDPSGNTDTRTDDTIPVQITIVDDPDGFDITFTATEPTADSDDQSGDLTATFTVTANNLPSGVTAANLLGIAVGETHSGSGRAANLGGNSWTEPEDGTATFTWSTTRQSGAGAYTYTAQVWYTTTQNGARIATAMAPSITVTW